MQRIEHAIHRNFMDAANQVEAEMESTYPHFTRFFNDYRNITRLYVPNQLVMLPAEEQEIEMTVVGGNFAFFEIYPMERQ